MLQASGSIVAFAEDHAFPDREWAETIIRAHQGPWTAVSPCVMNGNPQSMLSWADFLLSYGDWFATGPSREVKRALIHNGSFKRQALMQLGDSLDEYLAPSGRLVEHLTAAGHRSYIESQAVVRHLNISRYRPSLWLWLCLGRSFAGHRATAEGWTALIRGLYMLLTPAIPFLRLRAAWPAVRRGVRQQRLFPGIIPPLSILLAIYAVGELLGYALGVGEADRALESLEGNRFQNLNRQDQSRVQRRWSTMNLN